MPIGGKSKETLNLSDVRKARFFDFIIGNLDRHEGNYLVHNGKIKLIDNGMTFPVKISGDTSYFDLSAYRWQAGDLGKTEILDKNTAKFFKNFEREDFDFLIENSYLTKNEVDALYERYSLIKDMKHKNIDDFIDEVL